MLDLNPSQTAIVTLDTIFLFLAWTMTILRIWARAGVLQQFRQDDRVMVIAVLAYTVHAVGAIMAVVAGLGRPVDSMPREQIRRALHFEFSQQLTCQLVAPLIKISLGLQLCRIATQQHHLRAIRIFIIAPNVLAFVLSAFLGSFVCLPVHAYWNIDLIPSSQCFSRPAAEWLLRWAGISMMQTDIMLCILPFLIMKDIRMSRSRKSTLVCLLSLGAIATMATIPRVILLPTLYREREFTTLYYLEAVAYFICQEIELVAGIIFGSAATLTPLIKLIRDKLGLEGMHSNWERRLESWHTPRAAARLPSVAAVAAAAAAADDLPATRPDCGDGHKNAGAAPSPPALRRPRADSLDGLERLAGGRLDHACKGHGYQDCDCESVASVVVSLRPDNDDPAIKNVVESARLPTGTTYGTLQ